MENWLYLIRIVFILIIFLFIQGIINTIQKDLESDVTEEAPEIKTKRLKLEVIKGSEKIKLIKDEIDNLEEIHFGRDITNDIVVEDKYISSSHFKINKINEEYYLEDLNSTNGTTLNNRQIDKAVKLKNNDIISLGEIQFKAHVY